MPSGLAAFAARSRNHFPIIFRLRVIQLTRGVLFLLLLYRPHFFIRAFPFSSHELFFYPPPDSVQTERHFFSPYPYFRAFEVYAVELRRGEGEQVVRMLAQKEIEMSLKIAEPRGPRSEDQGRRSIELLKSGSGRGHRFPMISPFDTCVTKPPSNLGKQ